MNRIVIVGNGYDLFRGLNTRYEHFIIWYLKQSIDDAFNTEALRYEDSLIRVDIGEKVDKLPEEIDESTSIDEFDKISQIRINNHNPDLKHIISEHPDLIEDLDKSITITILSSLLHKVFKDLKWADIERIYFEELYETHRRNETQKTDSDRIVYGSTSPNQLNKDFDLIRKNLIIYLKSLNSKIKRDSMTPLKLDELHKRINEKLSKPIFEKYFDPFDNEDLETIKFLNFNYTEQLYIDLQKYSLSLPNITHIHGDLGIPESVIFGYGDMNNNEYELLKQTDNREYLRHLKHFRYKTTTNLENFTDVLEMKPFDVLVLGHSLGLSDRYLLNKIFKHQNCKLIRVFIRGGNFKYHEKTLALNHHISDDDWERKVPVYDELDTFLS